MVIYAFCIKGKLESRKRIGQRKNKQQDHNDPSEDLINFISCDLGYIAYHISFKSHSRYKSAYKIPGGKDMVYDIQFRTFYRYSDRRCHVKDLGSQDTIYHFQKCLVASGPCHIIHPEIIGNYQSNYTPQNLKVYIILH